MPKNPRPLGKAADVVKKPARPGHGGARAGAGAPKGANSAAATRRSKAAADRISAGELVIKEEYGELPLDATPLDVMVMAMRVAYRTGGALAAQPYARDAAPYLHARIAQMELKNADDAKPFTLAFRWASE
jgi:hypothetical protein